MKRLAAITFVVLAIEVVLMGCALLYAQQSAI